MISHQELSAQQVCSYLLDYEDHFTSHKYNNLYWTSFEKLIDDEDPSPSCYSRKRVSTDNTDPKNESDSDELDRYHSGEQDENEKEGDIDKENENENDSPETDEHDEICISVKQTGEIVAKASQVADYQLHGDCLNNISVWDYVAQIEKISKASDRQKSDDKEEILNDTSRKWKRIDLQHEHLEHISHRTKVRTPDKRVVPVPIGPSIPR